MGGECRQFARRIAQQHDHPRAVASVYLDRKARGHHEETPAASIAYLANKRHQLAAQPGFDTETRNAILNTPLPSSSGERVCQSRYVTFPSLGRAFAATGKPAGAYNCISHSVGNTSTWDFPGGNPDRYDRYYESAGLRRGTWVPGDQTAEAGTVLLYAWQSWTIGRAAGRMFSGGAKRKQPFPCHAVVSLGDGTWSSKMGPGRTIRIVDPRQLEGFWYGKVFRVYVPAEATSERAHRKGASATGQRRTRATWV